MSVFSVTCFRDNPDKSVYTRCTEDTTLAGSNLMFTVFPFLKLFYVQLLSGPQWYELQVGTAGEEFFNALMCDFE